MNYTDEQLNEAVKNNIISMEQAERFRDFVQKRGNDLTKFPKIIYYGGGLLIISAMTWLMGAHWDSLGPIGVAILSALYFFAFLIAGNHVFFKAKMEIAGGTLFCVSIAIIPLFVFSLLRAFGIWSQEWAYGDFFGARGRWVILEISVILYALPILFKTKFSFVVFLIAVSLWFLSMDVVQIISEKVKMTFTERAVVSSVFGLFMTGTGNFVEIKLKKGYSFWLYFFGLTTLLAGLFVSVDKDFTLVIFGVVSVLLTLYSLYKNENMFLIFGIGGLILLLCKLFEFYRQYDYFWLILAIFGLFVTGIGCLSDIKFKKRLSFNYIFGLTVLFAGLVFFNAQDLFRHILLGAVSILLIWFSLFIDRKEFLVFGAFGTIVLLSRLSFEFFKDSPFFPVALTTIGVLLILLGIYYQKNSESIKKKFAKKK